jgi:coenzyme F420-reducing hydrogenase gamma subunit
MRYLGIQPQRPRIGVFDFTDCEGCELQLTNKEESLVPFLQAVEVVNFREASSEKRDDYEIAFIEGAISREDEIERLKKIREKAKILVAMGSCACYGGVNKLKNAMDLAEVNRCVYGDKPKSTMAVRAVADVVKVDLSIPGCPVNKAEVERVVQAVVFGTPVALPAYPVCVECKQRFTTCMMERRGQLCLGSVSRAGCNAPCPAGGLPCWGCRGPAEVANIDEFVALSKRRGFKEWELKERFAFFGGFDSVLSREDLR